jgi:hypothetical protein
VIAGTPQSVATPTPGNTTRAAVEALFRHAGVFLWTVGIVLLATALITTFTPRTYESEMNILVRNARPDYLISPERSTGQIVQQDVTEERINSEIEVLKSKDVADVVVDPDWSATPLNERSDAQVKGQAGGSVAKRLDRGALRTFEQLSAAGAKSAAPRPVSPFAPRMSPVPVPAKLVEAVRPVEVPVSVVPPLQRSQQPPIEIADPIHRQAARALSPSQRLQLRRQEAAQERAGRLAYVTYSADGRK